MGLIEPKSSAIFTPEPAASQWNNLINGRGRDTFMLPMQIMLRKAINGNDGRRKPTKYMGQNKQDDSAGPQGPSPLLVILLEPLPVKKFGAFRIEL